MLSFIVMALLHLTHHSMMNHSVELMLVIKQLNDVIGLLVLLDIN